MQHLHRQLIGTDLYVVAGTQNVSLDALGVDERAVAAAEIFDDAVALGADQQSVFPAHLRIFQMNAALRISADNQGSVVQRVVPVRPVDSPHSEPVHAAGLFFGALAP